MDFETLSAFIPQQTQSAILLHDGTPLLAQPMSRQKYFFFHYLLDGGLDPKRLSQKAHQLFISTRGSRPFYLCVHQLTPENSTSLLGTFRNILVHSLPTQSKIPIFLMDTPIKTDLKDKLVSVLHPFKIQLIDFSLFL